MNPDFRKVALIAASLGLLVSLFLALRPQADDPAGTTANATTTAPATTAPVTTVPSTTTPQPTEPEAATTVRIAVEGGQPVGGIRRETVERDTPVELVVTADVSDHVHLHGYDLMADVALGAPARLTFVAEIPGRFEIELEELGVQLAELTVEP